MAYLRRLAPGDHREILRINAAGVPGVAALDAAELRRLVALPNTHLVTEDGSGRVAGYLLVFPRGAPYDGEEFLALRDALPGPFFYIDQVAIDPSQRRLGLGSALYTALEDAARVAGDAALCCEVNLVPPNAPSLAFHLGRGFSPLRELDTADGRRVALLVKGVG